MQLKGWIIIHETIERVGAQDQGGKCFPRVQGFARAGQDAGFHGLHEAVRDHFRMYAKIALACQTGENGIGDRADAHLQGGSIRYQGSDVLSDLFLHLARSATLQFWQGLVALYHHVHTGDMEKGISQDTRHLWINLDNHGAGGLGGGFGGQYLDAQANETVSTRWETVEDAAVEREKTGGKQRGVLGEKVGGIAGLPLMAR